MDPSTPRPSGIPRPSRLPVPSTALRSAASRENLQRPAKPNANVVNPRLRSTPTATKSRDSTHFLPRDRPVEGYHAELDLSEDEGVREGRTFARGELDKRASSRNPSLSERTMETLQHIPSSPAIRHRNSSFFNSETPRRSSPSSRHASLHQNEISMGPPYRSLGSRPSSSSGPDKPNQLDFRASPNTFRTAQSTLPSHTPVKRQSIASFKTPSSARSAIEPASSASKLPSPRFGASLRQQSPSPFKTDADIPTIKSGSKTLSSRPLKPRASVNGLFRKPSMPNLDQSNELDRIGFVKKKKSTTFSNTSSEESSTLSKASKSTTTTTSVSGDDQTGTPRKSSLALRDQIAKAKAAKRAADAKLGPRNPADQEEVPVIPSGTFDFGLHDDPFNQKVNQNDMKGLLRKRIDAARTDGRLNIAAMGFKEIPDEVLNMYSLESIGTQDGSWAESVDLKRLVAADNELELIHDDVFPDIDPREGAEDEDFKGNQFGGLETLDLHGNVLIALPLGLRRLELLTTLNLSNNKLGNDCFQIISQIPSLRDLKLAGNGLSGPLDASMTNLQNLEALDLQRNNLTSLPDGLAELVRLRVLNITENQFAALPFESLRQLPLMELLAAKNKLSGVLIAEDVDELPQLQVLDVTSNSLTRITESSRLSLPVLHQLSCSSNRLTDLPDMTSWVSLLTLIAEDNNISSIPEGFVTLPKIKNVDFSGNNIKVLDDNIGGMNSLDIFRISGNPLRDKKFSGMTTEDLKRALKARMAPVEQDVEKEASDGTFYSAQGSPVSSRPSSTDWLVKPGGILDRSNTESYSLNPVAAAHAAANHTIRVLELHHNVFKEIPSSIAFFAATLTTLSLARNELTSDTFLKEDLELPVLKELNLSCNTFNSVQPLIQRLQAPLLEKLDISFNRLTFLPPLKPHFPSLTSLFASNNTIKELSPESIKGLKVVDCSSNDISSLNARIGLLGGPGGLERLDVTGNRFKVPKYTILEKGTEATLTWLRDRIPAGEPTSPTDID